MPNIVTQRFISCHNELKDKGLIKSSRQFAILLDYLPQSLNEILRGHRDVTIDLIRKSVETFYFNPEFLFTGKGPKFKTDEYAELSKIEVDSLENQRNMIRYVPVAAQAGYVEQFNNILFENDLPAFNLPDDRLKSGTYRCFDVAGDSMEPTLVAGDKIVCSIVNFTQNTRNIKDNHVYVVVMNDSIVVKRLKQINNGKSNLLLISDNNFYEEKEISMFDIKELWHVDIRITQFMPSYQQNYQSFQEELSGLKKIIEVQNSTIHALNATIEKLLKASRDKAYA